MAGWVNSDSLPESRYVGHLEQLLGAPWSYLDNPDTTLPRKWTTEALNGLLSLFPDSEIDDLAREIEMRRGRRGGGANRR